MLLGDAGDGHELVLASEGGIPRTLSCPTVMSVSSLRSLCVSGDVIKSEARTMVSKCARSKIVTLRITSTRQPTEPGTKSSLFGSVLILALGVSSKRVSLAVTTMTMGVQKTVVVTGEALRRTTNLQVQAACSGAPSSSSFATQETRVRG